MNDMVIEWNQQFACMKLPCPFPMYLVGCLLDSSQNMKIIDELPHLGFHFTLNSIIKPKHELRARGNSSWSSTPAYFGKVNIGMSIYMWVVGCFSEEQIS